MANNFSSSNVSLICLFFTFTFWEFQPWKMISHSVFTSLLVSNLYIKFLQKKDLSNKARLCENPSKFELFQIRDRNSGSLLRYKLKT